MKFDVLYDFRRSFLRISVLSFLLLFVIAGVLLTYEFLYSIPPAEFNDVNVVVTAENTTSGYHFLGLVFDNQGNPISNAKVTVVCSNSTKTLFTNSSGYFSFYGTPIKIIVTYDGQQKSISLPSYQSYANVSEFYNYFVPGYVLIIGYNGKTAKVIAFIPNITLYFLNGTTFRFPPTKNIALGNVTIAQSMRIFTVTIPKGTSFVYAVYKIDEGYSSGGAPFNSILLIEANFLEFVGAFTSYYFSLAFSIIFIYIAYQMFGKLKERGLPLLLARPITRGELYFTRYFSGVLALVLSALIFSLATSIMFVAYTGVFLSYYTMIILAFTFSNIIVWYSLSYLFFSKLSPSKGLGLSIGMFIVLDFLVLIIPFIPSKLIYYFYPASFAFSLLNYLMTLSYPISPAISALAETVWIVVPVIVGYLIFKKIDV